MRWRRLLRHEPDSTELRRSEALGRVIRDSWTAGPPAPDPEALIARLRPALARMDEEIGERSPAARLRERLRALTPPIRPVAFTASLAAAALALMLVLPPLTPTGTGPGIASAQASTQIRSLRSPQSVRVFVLEGGDGCAIIWVVQDEVAPDRSSNDFWGGARS